MDIAIDHMMIAFSLLPPGDSMRLAILQGLVHALMHRCARTPGWCSCRPVPPTRWWRRPEPPRTRSPWPGSVWPRATVSAEEILHVAAARRSPGSLGLVSLAACSTHLAGRGYDQAVTLATVFLVAGASSTVDALWRVPDRDTALLMLAFHDHLLRRGLPPRDALRAAQRWLRDPDREPFADLPAQLRRSTAEGAATLAGWAGFVHVGA